MAVLLQILKREEIEGVILPSVEENEIFDICEIWNRENILKLCKEKYRLEDALQLVMVTMLDFDTMLLCETREKENQVKLGVYLHGKTIVIMLSEDSDTYQIMWVPFLPLAIGAVSKLISEEMDKSQEHRAKLRIRGKGESSFETYILDNKEEKIEEEIKKVTRWLAVEHSRCMGGIA